MEAGLPSSLHPARLPLSVYRWELEAGDFVFRSGDAPVVDPSFLNRYEHRFSHSGLVLDEGRVAQIHPTEAGSKAYVGSFSDFVRDAHDWAVYRPKFSLAQRLAIAKQAETYAEKHLPFDSGFNMEDGTKLYCSELLWRATLEATGTDLVPEKPSILSTNYLPLDSLYLNNPHVTKIHDHLRSTTPNR